jgi:serine/threonine protein phosphatase PrpC
MFETGAATHIGKVRTRNEDSYLVRAEAGLWAVADGMGGYEDGHIASGALVEELQLVRPPASASELLDACEGGLLRANARLQERARERGASVGATVAILLAYERHFACIWAGDSRIYRVRAGVIEQLTQDHTEVEELIASGALGRDQAQAAGRQNVVTRAIGVYPQPELEISHGALEPEDAFVLCSDGLTTHVPDKEILARVNSGDSQDAYDSLVCLTLERGAIDNVTVVVVRYRPNGEEQSASPAQTDSPAERGE